MKSLETLSKEIADKEKEKSMKAESEKRHDDLLGSVKEVKESVESMKETLGSLSVTVENQIEPKDSVKVENLSEISFPKSVKVENIKDIKFPAPVKEVSVKKPSWLSFSGIEENIKSLRKAVIDLGEIDLGKYTKKQDALAVRLVDKDGIGYYNAGGGGGYTIDRTKITDESGRIWSLESNGAMPVNIQDQTSDLFMGTMARAIGSPMTLASTTVKDSYQVTLTAGHTFTAGDCMLIVCRKHEFLGKVLSVAGNVITLDSPLDCEYLASSSLVFEIQKNMNVNGSVRPVKYEVALGETSDVEIDIYEIRFKLFDNSAMDESRFGGMTALTRGVVLRVERADGTIKNYFNAKSNGMFSLYCDNNQYDTKAPSGQYSVEFKWKVSRDQGVAIRLSAGDKFVLIVQDDLTPLINFEAKVLGHEVTD